MKSLLILAFAGLACSTKFFSPGEEYVYNYYGRILTGIPQIDSTFAGMSMEGNVIVQALSQNSYKMMIKNVKFGTFNEQLSGSSQQPTNWRNVEVEANTALTSEYQQYMESPVEFSLEQGEFSAVKVSSQEPQWSVNFKKALIASIKVQQPSQLEETTVEQRRNPRFWNKQRSDSTEQYYWTTMEEGIEGKCENTYHVSELPEYMVTEYERGMLKTELCQGKKYYQVTRTKDITKCQDWSMYLSSKGHKNCLIGNCDTVNTKQSQTRYYGCGNTVQDMKLHGMISEGELQHSVLAFNTENVVTGTKQVLKLQEVKSSQSHIPDITSVRTCHDLSYEFPHSQGQSSVSHSRDIYREINREERKNPENHNFSPLSADHVDIEKAKTEIVKKIQQISSEIGQVDKFAEKEFPSELKSLKTILFVMKTEDLKQMYQQIQSSSSSQQQKETARSLFLAIVRNSGTSPSVMFLKQMIEMDQLSEWEKFMVVTTFNHYIKTPTEELIDQIFQLIKSNSVSSKIYLKAPAHLMFGSLIRQACFQTNTRVYPEYVYGKMCSPNNPKITQEYIPYLVNQLKNAQTESEKQFCIYALGHLGHESVFPLLMNYIEGKNQDSQSSHYLRKAAMYSLIDVAYQYRNTLLPVYLSILHNPAEKRDLRIAAIAAVMKMQPTTVQLQKMAVSTWFEQDHEVAKYVYSTIKSYAVLRSEDHPTGSYMRQLSQQCQTVIQLAKPFHHVFSVYQASSGYLSELQIGATMINTIMKGKTGTEVYHKTDYYLKQAKTTPMEFAGHVSGLNTIFKNIMKDLGFQTSNQELKEILKELEVSPRTSPAFEAGAWLRLSDDIEFSVDFNQGHIDVLKEKVLEAIKDSGFNLMKKVCGRHQINSHNVFEELPYTAIVPSDIGLPIMVDSQITYLVSLQGELNLECSLTSPSAQLELSKKLSYSYNGYAGTFCPFTQEMLAAGINIHRQTNIPAVTKVELQPQTGKLSVSINPTSQVSQASNIDVLHYHVKPYTTKKTLFIQDMTPEILSPETKIIKSRASPKTFQANFGQAFGVDLKLKVETECDLYDKKTMMDSWSNYHYNPMVASWFSFTETALTASGRPTARYHKYTLTHNPAQSSTKGAEMEVELSLATKVKSQQIKNIKLSPNHSHSTEASTKLESCLNKLDSKYGYAFNAYVTCKLTGSQTQTYTYSVTAGAGQDNLEHKWDLDLNLQNQNKKVCMSGYMKYPTTPSSQALFKYNNKVGFGETCEQYHINIDGHTQVSQQQREKSSYSIESEKCEVKSQEEERLRLKIKSYSHQSEEKKIVEEKHAKVAAEKLKYCSKKKEQSRTLDYTQFDISYSSQMPEYVYSAAKTANIGLKAVLYQYISYIKEQSSQNRINVKLNFNEEQNSLTMTVASPEDTVQYRNIRLPSQLNGVVPFVAGMNPAEQSYKALTGEAMMAQCVLGEGYIQTFDKNTYSYQIDECDHLVTSDCSGQNHHAVMAKEVNGMKHVTILSGQTKIYLSPAQAYSNQVEEYRLTVNGQSKTLQPQQKITLSQQDKITAYLTQDKTVIISCPSLKITHSGKTVKIEDKEASDGSHCGLCGDHNNDKRVDLKSPKNCIMESTTLFAKSYRSKSSQCSPLPQPIVEKIRSEEEKCLRFETKKTPVTSIYSSGHKDSYSVKKHSYIYKEDKLCISQEPVVQCSSGSIPRAMKKKMIKFVCLPEGRISKLYSERIERGESPQELKHQPVAFKVEMEQPVTCGPQL